MGSFLVVAFWIWCGISIVILITRPFYRRRQQSGAPRPASDPFPSLDQTTPATSPDTGAAPESPSTGALSGQTEMLSGQDQAEPPAEGGLFGDRDAEPTADHSERAAEHADHTEPAAEHADHTEPAAEHGDHTEPAAEHVDHTGPAAEHAHGLTREAQVDPGPISTDSGPPVPSNGSPAAVRSRSIADALTGIRMPCDLAPLMGLGETLDPAHVVFSTEGHRPDHVGQTLGDELERIGCSLKPINDNTVYADRGADCIEVVIHPDPKAVMDGAEPRFPTAPADAVVVEFRMR